MSKRLIPLRHHFPTVSRATLWRMKNQPGFPAGVNIGGTEYFYEDELVAYEETHRRQRSETRTPAGSHEPEAPSPALLRKDAPPKAVT